MGRLFPAIYDRTMQKTEDACLRDWRRELLSEARGRVIEIGAGTGASIEHYPGDLDKLVLTEPDPHMRKRLAERCSDAPLVEILDAHVETIPVEDASFDTAFVSLVLCSVRDPAIALAEVHRVLAPGGRLIFIEHVAAEAGSSRRRWQGFVEPLWKLCAGNCHVTRDTESTIANAGFEIERVKRESMRKAFPWTRPSIRGIALKTAIAR